jgi:peptide/nickel transport system ATP-binding protein
MSVPAPELEREHPTTAEPVVEVDDLRVEVVEQGLDIVDEVSFQIGRGEVLGLVGESGSGKTTVGLALMGHTRRGARIVGGRILVDGREILKLPRNIVRALRGRTVSYVPQDPAAALNPAIRIGVQLEETLSAHDFGSSREERRERLAEMLDEVLLPGDQRFLARYPHQLSGGQQQRVGLAMAFACRPSVIVLDEPTTGLDVTTQAHVLDTVRDLCNVHRVAALYVSHDLAVVASLASRVAVMYAGRIVELGPREALYHRAAHPYARRLIEAIPEMSGHHALVGIPGSAPRPGHRPSGCFFEPRCTYAVERCAQEFPPVERAGEHHDVRCYRHAHVLEEAARGRKAAEQLPAVGRDTGVVAVEGINASYGERQVLHDVSLAVQPQECLALVGESGSGKTTLARCISGLHRDFTGEITLLGERLERGARARSLESRQRIQYVFQSPYTSLNPRRTVGQIVGQPLKLFFGFRRRQVETRVVSALEHVALGPSVVDRYPDQLSGGERQRVAIARALVCKPSLLICDEVTSALDVSVQAAIVQLLRGLQRDMGLTMLFVTHNLPLVRAIAHRIVVMSDGRIVEAGAADRVLDAPEAEYTRELLAAIPELEELPAVDSAPSGR